jgi:hypothetical protein
MLYICVLIIFIILREVTVMMFNATSTIFQKYRAVLLMDETRVPGENLFNFLIQRGNEDLSMELIKR